MRGGLNAIQQTLTPEAASVLSHSIAEAGRRNHGQTTPLHVAATLLASPTGFLRQACIRSHPNSSHPLQCRALELCFSVALERLPTAAHSSAVNGEPPISNALMAALKRAQAHQRRGCPEQQQQPLLAVKVELEQLIISILDDPSVSRVMREASFSSPAVKSAVEAALSSRTSAGPATKPALGFRPGLTPVPRNLYLNPRLQQQNQNQAGRGDDVKRVLEILTRPRKRNPVLVGESEPQEVVKEVLKNVETHEGVLKGVEVVSMAEELLGSDRAQVPAKLCGMIERKMGVGGGVVVDLGDLKWLVDQPANPAALEAARATVTEMGRILARFGGEGRRVWVIGTATCETYLRCQVYHPTMENEWDLQVVSIVARPATLPGMLPRLGTNGGILSSSVESLSPMKNFPMTAPSLTRRVSENLDPSRRFNCCPQCTEKCNQEVAKLTAEQAEKPAPEAVSDAGRTSSLPPWLQSAKLRSSDPLQGKDQDLILKQKTQEVQKKWSDACVQLHPSFHHTISSERITPSPISMTGLYNPALLGRTPLQPKLQQQPQLRTLGDALQLNISPPAAQPPSPPGSPVRTDLVLGRAKPAGESPQDKAHKERLSGFLTTTTTTTTNTTTTSSDVDSFKRLLKGLVEKVAWQRDAASSIASAVTQCKTGNGKRRANGLSKGDIWLLFSGPDRTGKKKMAAALAELVYGASAPILISLGSRRYGDESELNFRGKTAIDRIAEAVRRNPCSVIMLQDIDEADVLVQASVKRAMERGRLSDSHGREISLGNVIFVLTSSWVPDQQQGGYSVNDEEKLTALASGGWQLRISVGETSTAGKRPPPPNWVLDDDDEDEDHDRDWSSKQQRKEEKAGFDLNQMADVDDGSHNSSDLTVEHEEAHAHGRSRGSPTSAVPHELLSSVDEAVVFKPVDFTPVRQNIERAITVKFSAVTGDRVPVRIENAALEKIQSGLWLGQTGLETWVDRVLVPGIQQIKTKLPEGKQVVARLELDKESKSRAHGDWLPSKISVAFANAQ